MGIEDDLRAVQTRISAVQSKKARAEVERDAAKATLEIARSTLKEQFGISSSAEITSVRDALEKDRAALLTALEEELTKAGA